MQKIMLVILASFITTLTYAREIIPQSNYFLRDGLNSPVFGELGAQVTEEYGPKNTILNTKFGFQFIRSESQSVALGYVIRGFQHGHSSREDYKLRLDGVALEYLYSRFDLKPIFGFTYLTGEKRSNLEPDVEQVINIDNLELSFSLSYPLTLLQSNLVVGYNHAFSTTSSRGVKELFGLTHANGKVELESRRASIPPTRNQKSEHDSLLAGLRFSSF